MGVVLTSRSARDMLLEAPDSYAAHFDLAPAEAALLAGMAADLVGLMPGFVQKRERSLRRTFAVTLSLLGAEATPLIEDYSDAYAPVDSSAAETLRFADFLVEEARELADGLPYGNIVADVARYERLRLRSFMAEGPLWPTLEEAPLDPRLIDRGRPALAAPQRRGRGVRVGCPHRAVSTNPPPAAPRSSQPALLPAGRGRRGHGSAHR